MCVYVCMCEYICMYLCVYVVVYYKINFIPKLFVSNIYYKLKFR